MFSLSPSGLSKRLSILLITIFFLQVVVFQQHPVPSTSWKFSLYFVFIFRTAWNFLIKFSSSHQNFKRDNLITLYLSTETDHEDQTLHKSLLVTTLFTNFLSWHDIETYIGDTVWWISFIYGFMSLLTRLFPNSYSGL